MGSGRFDHAEWKSYTSTGSKGYDYQSAPVDQIYARRAISQALDPRGITVRESRDSADNPQSTPVIVALDVTGSMGMVLEAMAKDGLPTLMTEIYGRKPVTDPHVMALGIGDCEHDAAPLQATQFEADIRIAQQLEDLYLERGGGGNNYESYALAWYFAARHCATDAWEKRGQKGFLFTVGDEEPTQKLVASDVTRVFGRTPVGSLDVKDVLAAAEERWHVYHLMVAEGSHARTHKDRVRSRWTDLLGQRAVWLADHKRMAQAIVTLLLLAQGQDANSVIASWDADTGKVLRAMDLAGAPA